MPKFHYASFLLSIIALTAISGCNDTAAIASSTTASKTSIAWARADAAPVTYRIEEVATGLDHPWALAFLPKGDMLVTERAGRVRLIKDGRLTHAPVLDFTKFETAPVHVKSQAGLFDIALSPDYEETNAVYLTYAGTVEKKKNTLILVKAVYDAAASTLKEVEPLFAATPARTTSAHYGGRLIFLADGTLMFGNGDGYQHKEQAQKLDTHYGKMIRLNLDGTVPADNPFTGQEGALPEIYSYGHRNPQGLLVASDGRIFEHEHGPKGGDEINIIDPGVNYGWPAITYGIDYSGAQISPYQAYEGMAQPLVHFTPSIAPSGFVQYTGDKFPNWQGGLFLSALAHENVRYVEMREDGFLGEQAELFKELGQRIRDVRQGPDGYLYLLTEERGSPDGKVLRVVPK